MGLITRFVSFINGLFDKYVVDSCVNFWWWISQLLSSVFRTAETGSAKDYLTMALLGVVVISMILLFAF